MDYLEGLCDSEAKPKILRHCSPHTKFSESNWEFLTTMTTIWRHQLLDVGPEWLSLKWIILAIVLDIWIQTSFRCSGWPLGSTWCRVSALHAWCSWTSFLFWEHLESRQLEKEFFDFLLRAFINNYVNSSQEKAVCVCVCLCVCICFSVMSSGRSRKYNLKK